GDGLDVEGAHPLLDEGGDPLEHLHTALQLAPVGGGVPGGRPHPLDGVVGGADHGEQRGGFAHALTDIGQESHDGLLSSSVSRTTGGSALLRRTARLAGRFTVRPVAGAPSPSAATSVAAPVPASVPVSGPASAAAPAGRRTVARLPRRFALRPGPRGAPGGAAGARASAAAWASSPADAARSR